MNVFDILQLIGGIILAIGYIPQIIQIIKTKSCSDLNITTYVLLMLGIGLMEIYAMKLVLSSGYGLMFLVTNTISLFMVGVVNFLIVWTLCTSAGKNSEESTDVNRHIKDAIFISRWTDDSSYATPCKVNDDTKEIIDIVWVDEDKDCPLREEVVMIDGTEYPAVQLSEGYWYD